MKKFSKTACSERRCTVASKTRAAGWVSLGEPQPHKPAMKSSSLFLFVALGAIFWLNAALIIRFTGAAVFTANNPWLVFFFALAVPLTLLSMYITAQVSKLKFGQLLKPVVVMTYTATFLDAVALAWFRGLYSESYEVALHGAAWILWGAGLGLLFASYFEGRSAAASGADRAPSLGSAE